MEEYGRERLSSSIVQSVGHEGESSHSPPSKDFKPFIFRIPGLFKMRNEQACTPYKFSIGPWHVGKTQLLRTGQILKESIFEGLINRFPDPAAKKRELEDFIEEVHDRAIECYEGEDVYDGGEKSDVIKQDFQKMLLLDGCFIIELLHNEQLRKRNQTVFFSGVFHQIILHDLLVLDNQIPWFVLQNLFHRIEGNLRPPLQLAFRIMSLFDLPFSHEIHIHDKDLPSLNILHLVHLVRYCWVGPPKMKLSSSYFEWENKFKWDNMFSIPSAARLQEAGVKFQKVESTGMLDVTFDSVHGVLEISRLRITPVTQTIFRNLIIFEQCFDCVPYVTGYAVVLDCLIDTSDDVALMSRAEIFDNWLSPEETINLFNRVRNNTLLSVFHYALVCNDVNIYCKRRCSRLRASLIRNYFTKLWAIVSVVYAMINLFFTIMKVFYK